LRWTFPAGAYLRHGAL